MNMKKFISLLAAILLAAELCAVTAQLSVSPARPVAGELFTVEIKVDTAERFSLRLPEIKGLKISRSISSNSINQNIINGKATVEAVYGLQALAENHGKVTIPPFMLDFNGKKVTTNALEITIRDAATLPAGEKLSMTMTVEPERKLYVGETVAVNLELVIPDEWRLQGVGDISITDFADAAAVSELNSNGIRRSGSSSFSRMQNSRNRAGLMDISGIFQLQKSGEFHPVAKVLLQLSKTGENDFFFAPPPQRKVVTAKMDKKITVLPLPEAPANAVNTRLLGSWKISGSISKNVLKAGDIAEITLEFTGKMPTMGFRAPELNIADARVYPAEVTSGAQNRRFTVKYPFVALKAGNYKITLLLAVFNPEKGDYELNKIYFEYKVDANSEMSVPAAPAIPEEEKTVKSVPVSAELVPFPPIAPKGSVKLPLMRNITPFLLIPAVILAALFITVIVSGKKSDPEKKQQKKMIRKLINEINFSGNATDSLLNNGTAGIAEALGLSAGTSFSDIADKVEKNDRLLAQFFRQLEAGQFAPGDSTVTENEQLRSRICAFLKKLLTVVIIFAGFSLSAATFAEGKNAFDRGNYRESVKLFTQLTGEKGADPALYYDLGSSYYMQKDYTKAYLNFTRASLLSPADTRFRAAAESTAAKLPAEIKGANWWQKSIRFCRPDQWIILALTFASLACWGIYLRKKLPFALTSTAIVLICSALMLGAATAQSMTDYDPDRAIVTAKNALLRSVPAASGGMAATLPEGTELFIMEKSGSYYRVENESLSGWIEQKDVERFL